MSVWERVDAALNPVLVKEVRQSLRSRLFRVGYVATLIVAAMASILAVAEGGERTGAALFSAVYAALVFAVAGLVPFYTFYTSPGEGQDRALELLQLTRLRPARIAAGRNLAALTQVALFYCAFLPFLAVSAVLPGVDLLAALVLLVGAGVLAASTSAVAIALGTILRSRIVRALVGLGLSGMLLYTAAGAAMVAFAMLERPERLLEPDGMLAVALLLAVPAVFGVFAFGATAAALAHPEENRSTPLRVATLVFAVLGVAGVSAMCQMPYTSAEEATVAALIVLGLLGVPVGVFLVEPDRVGRRVRALLPRPALSVLLAPLLPGGRTAALLAGLVLGGFVLLASLTLGLAFPGEDLSTELAMLWTALAYGVLYLGLPALVARPWLGAPVARWVALFAMPGLFFAGLLVPTFVGFALNDQDWSRMRHYGNPLWLIGRLDGSATGLPDLLPVWLVGLAVAVAHLPRAVRGLADIAKLASERHARRP